MWSSCFLPFLLRIVFCSQLCFVAHHTTRYPLPRVIISQFSLPANEEFFEVTMGYNLSWTKPIEGYFQKFLVHYRSFCLSTQILDRYHGPFEINETVVYQSRNQKYKILFDDFENKGARVVANVSNGKIDLFDFVVNDHQVSAGWSWTTLKIRPDGILVLLNKSAKVSCNSTSLINNNLV